MKQSNKKGVPIMPSQVKQELKQANSPIQSLQHQIKETMDSKKLPREEPHPSHRADG